MKKIICFFKGHEFKHKAPRLPVRLKGESEYRRHNCCARCHKTVIVLVLLCCFALSGCQGLQTEEPRWRMPKRVGNCRAIVLPAGTVFMLDGEAYGELRYPGIVFVREK